MKYEIIDKPGLEETSGDVDSPAAQCRAHFPVRLRDFSNEVQKIPKLSF